MSGSGQADPLVVECKTIRPYLREAIKKHGDRKSLARYLGVRDRQLHRVLYEQEVITLTVADRWFQKLGLGPITSLPDIKLRRNPMYSKRGFRSYFEKRGDPVPVDVIS